jgi:hypothetical protein
MLKLKDFKGNFHHHDVPDEIVKLVEFQNTLPTPYARGFALAVDDKKLLKPFSEKREFLDALCPLGRANSTGSLYALWARGEGKSTRESPVLVFGESGGVHVVAESPLHFLRLLTLDAEPMVDEGSVLYLKEESDPPSPRAKEYAGWLEHHFRVRPVRDAAEVEVLVRSAQGLLEKLLQGWLKHFGK